MKRESGHVRAEARHRPERPRADRPRHAAPHLPSPCSARWRQIGRGCWPSRSEARRPPPRSPHRGRACPPHHRASRSPRAAPETPCGSPRSSAITSGRGLPSGSVRPPHRGDERPRAAAVAVLAQIDPLPGAERQPSSGDRQCQRGTEQRRFDVRRHVVGALGRVRPVGRPLGDRLIEPRLEVAPDVGRRVLVQRERCRRVADQQVEQANVDELAARAARPAPRASRCESRAGAARAGSRAGSTSEIGREPSHPHVDTCATEWDALGLEQRPLASALGERAVGPHDPVPRDRFIRAVVEHRARDPWRPRRDIPIRAHEPHGRSADSAQDLARVVPGQLRRHARRIRIPGA